MEELAKGGEGTLFEIGFEVDDIVEFGQRMKAKGTRPGDLAERPIDDD